MKASISKEIIQRIQLVTGLSVNKMAQEADIPRSTLSSVMLGINVEINTEAALRLMRLLQAKEGERELLKLLKFLFSEKLDESED